jgi:hypothetical protein
MADNYVITSQKYTTERQSDGSSADVVEIGFSTKTEPPTHGRVAVLASLTKDPVAYADAVKTAVESAVESHDAVAKL